MTPIESSVVIPKNTGCTPLCPSKCLIISNCCTRRTKSHIENKEEIQNRPRSNSGFFSRLKSIFCCSQKIREEQIEVAGDTRIVERIRKISENDIDSKIFESVSNYFVRSESGEKVEEVRNNGLVESKGDLDAQKMA